MSIHRAVLGRMSVRRAILAAVASALVFTTVAGASPADATTYRAVASLPGATRADRIVVSRVGINLPIRNGSIGGVVRERIAYHYPGTTWPGGKGNTYLYGHARTGSFVRVWRMRVGDIISLHLVNGSWVRYRVTTVRRVKWNDGRWTLLGNTEKLTLQTCLSWYPHADKFVVVAVPVR